MPRLLSACLIVSALALAGASTPPSTNVAVHDVVSMTPAASGQGPVDPGDDGTGDPGDGSGDDDGSNPFERFFESAWNWLTGGSSGAEGGQDSAGEMTPSSCRPPGSAGPGTLRATDFGARPNDGDDDGPAIQCALDSMVAGQTLVFDPGEYRHAKVLRAGVADVRITGPGAVLTATDERNEAFRIDADRVAADTLTFGVVPTSARIPGRQRCKIWVSGHDGVTLTDVTVTGAAAAGVMVSDGASGFRLERVTVTGTRADGIHMTDGATGGTVDRPTVSRTGDDGVAVVSYQKDPAPVSGITVNSPRVFDQIRGRGVSVVGGENITYNDVDVRSSPSAAVYIAVEGSPWNTRDVRGVTIRGGTLVGSNTKPTVDHGAVLVFLGTPEAQMDQVVVENLTIAGTRPSASASVAVKTVGGQQPVCLQFDGLRFAGGPGRPFGGNVPATAYRVAG